MAISAEVYFVEGKWEDVSLEKVFEVKFEGLNLHL